MTSWSRMVDLGGGGFPIQPNLSPSQKNIEMRITQGSKSVPVWVCEDGRAPAWTSSERELLGVGNRTAELWWKGKEKTKNWKVRTAVTKEARVTEMPAAFFLCWVIHGWGDTHFFYGKKIPRFHAEYMAIHLNMSTQKNTKSETKSERKYIKWLKNK